MTILEFCNDNVKVLHARLEGDRARLSAAIQQAAGEGRLTHGSWINFAPRTCRFLASRPTSPRSSNAGTRMSLRGRAFRTRFRRRSR